MSNIILEMLRDWHKLKEKKFTGTIYLLPKDYQYVLENIKVQIGEDGKKLLYGLVITPSTKEDLAWTAIEFTGWDKNNPELLEFVKDCEFREFLYKNKNKEK